MASSLIPLNSLILLSAADLATLKTNYLNCLNAIATSGQEYELGGRKFRRPDIGLVTDTINAITYAQAVQAGTGTRRTLARFR